MTPGTLDVDAYLDRIAAARPSGTTPEDLRDLHRAHVDTVPFENLSVPLGETISLDVESLFDKIVTRRRGGFCYEMNGLFSTLLRQLGFEVALLAAQVCVDGQWGPPFDHLSLRVRCSDETDWLADVGFGAYFRDPVRLDADGEHVDAHGTFSLTTLPDGDVVVSQDGSPATRQEMRPRELGDFAAMCWYQQASPQATFSHRVICTLPIAGGRVSLSGNRLITTLHGAKTETELPDDAAILEAYRTHFGIVLTEVPRFA